MIKLKILKSRGFTLIEMIIYIALVSVLLIALTEVLISLLNTKLESESTSPVEGDGRFIIARLNYDLKRMLPTDTITSPASLGGSSNTLTFTISGTTYTYALSGSNLTLNDNTGALNLNSSESFVSTINPTLVFTKIGNPGGKESIKVSYKITSRTQSSSGPEIRNFLTTIGRR